MEAEEIRNLIKEKDEKIKRLADEVKTLSEEKARLSEQEREARKFWNEQYSIQENEAQKFRDIVEALRLLLNSIK